MASIIQHTAEANERDWAAVPEFDDFERDRNKEGDKTYAVTMLYGSPYERLIAVNGQSLNGRRQEEEQEKYKKEISVRQHESADKRSRRIAKYQAERKRDHTLIQQMTTGFHFRLPGNEASTGTEYMCSQRRPARAINHPIATARFSPAWKGQCGLIRKRSMGEG